MVFTGLFDLKKPGEYPYMLVNGESGVEEIRHEKPPLELIRHEVSYDDLPEHVRRRVLEVYREMWGLPE